jgi:hypothetical protein
VSEVKFNAMSNDACGHLVERSIVRSRLLSALCRALGLVPPTAEPRSAARSPASRLQFAASSVACTAVDERLGFDRVTFVSPASATRSKLDRSSTSLLPHLDQVRGSLHAGHHLRPVSKHRSCCLSRAY